MATMPVFTAIPVVTIYSDSDLSDDDTSLNGFGNDYFDHSDDDSLTLSATIRESLPRKAKKNIDYKGTCETRKKPWTHKKKRKSKSTDTTLGKEKIPAPTTTPVGTPATSSDDDTTTTYHSDNSFFSGSLWDDCGNNSFSDLSPAQETTDKVSMQLFHNGQDCGEFNLSVGSGARLEALIARLSLEQSSASSSTDK